MHRGNPRHLDVYDLNILEKALYVKRVNRIDSFAIGKTECSDIVQKRTQHFSARGSTDVFVIFALTTLQPLIMRHVKLYFPAFPPVSPLVPSPLLFSANYTCKWVAARFPIGPEELSRNVTSPRFRAHRGECSISAGHPVDASRRDMDSLVIDAEAVLPFSRGAKYMDNHPSAVPANAREKKERREETRHGGA